MQTQVGMSQLGNNGVTTYILYKLLPAEYFLPFKPSVAWFRGEGVPDLLDSTRWQGKLYVPTDSAPYQGDELSVCCVPVASIAQRESVE